MKKKKLQKEIDKLGKELVDNNRKIKALFPEGQYNTACPHCGGPIKLVGYTASCDIAIEPDGWGLSDGPCDTSDEVFKCGDCDADISSAYVFKVAGAKK